METIAVLVITVSSYMEISHLCYRSEYVYGDKSSWLQESVGIWRNSHLGYRS